MTWLLDLDGVVRLADEPIPGSVEAVRRLRDAGCDVLFATNNAADPIAAQEEQLRRMGVESDGRLVGSAQAAASLLSAGERVMVVGDEGLLVEVEAVGALPVAVAGPVDAVVCGLDRSFTYARLEAASRAIRDGARWIATNTDPTYPTPDGLAPGAGSIVSAITAAAGREPIVAGKPCAPMVELIRCRGGEEGIVVGDRADTDGALAEALGYRFGLVLSGATGEDEDPGPAEWVAPDLATLVDRLL